MQRLRPSELREAAASERRLEELIDALTRPQDTADRHRACGERYCPHDDGWAAARVLDHLGLK